MTQIESLKRRNVVLGVLAVALFLFWILRPAETSAVTSEALPALFPDLEAEVVRTVLLDRSQGEGADAQVETIRIQRAGEAGWALASSHGYPASPEKVNRFLEDLQGTKRKKFITERAETFGEYASPEGWIHVEVQGEGGTPLADFHLGKSAGWPDSFVRVQEEGKEVVVRAYNLSATDVRLTPDAWTEPRLWPGLTLPDVERIDVHQRDEKSVLSFLREERAIEPAEGEPVEGEPKTERVWKMVAPKQADPDKFKIEGLIRTFSGMRFASVAATAKGEAEDEHFGFATPAYRIAVFGAKPEGNAEAPRFVLLVGGEVPAEKEGAPSDRRYVRRADDSWIFEVTSTSVGDFRQAADDYLPVPEEPAEPAEPAPEGDAHGSPDDGDDPDAPPPPGDLPPMPPDDPAPPEAPDDPAPPEDPNDE